MKGLHFNYFRYLVKLEILTCIDIYIFRFTYRLIIILRYLLLKLLEPHI